MNLFVEFLVEAFGLTAEQSYGLIVGFVVLISFNILCVISPFLQSDLKVAEPDELQDGNASDSIPESLIPAVEQGMEVANPSELDLTKPCSLEVDATEFLEDATTPQNEPLRCSKKSSPFIQSKPHSVPTLAELSEDDEDVNVDGDRKRKNKNKKGKGKDHNRRN
jgi:hypothetical protein